MSKKKKEPSATTNPAQSLAQLETPQIKWKTILQIVAALAVVWITSLILIPYLGFWILGFAGLITMILAGFGIYILMLTRRSRAVIDIMKGATDEVGRKEAIDKLARDGSKDAMKLLARAQLVAQSKPLEALEILEGIDLKKAPVVLQDDIRSQLTLLYLRNNRIRDARIVADDIRLDRQPSAKAKAMYAAVIAESFARTGKPDEAKKLLDTFPPGESEYGEARALLLRAQVYTCIALKKRGLARKAMEELAQIEPNLLGSFIQKGTQPELMKIAKQVLSGSGMMQKPKMVRMR